MQRLVWIVPMVLALTQARLPAFIARTGQLRAVRDYRRRRLLERLDADAGMTPTGIRPVPMRGGKGA